MNEVLHLTYESSISNIHELNSSFDSGVLRICYTGANRNKTYFSKNTLEKSIPTLFNCPVVCNYKREDGSIGGHDMEVITDYDGELRLINLTQPVGVIPESANVYFEVVEEEDGTKNEYLCSEVILWKRQEAYKLIKENGITAESMEINVKDGARVDNVYVVNDFEFTAFALLGDCEPCFESASLQTYSSLGQEFKDQFAAMMDEFKDTFNLAATSEEVDNTDFNHSKKGGCTELEYRNLETSLEEEVVIDDINSNDPGEGVNEPTEEQFALDSNLNQGIHTAFGAVTVSTEWGEMPRYCICDYDTDEHKIYAWDSVDWLLYGFDYTMDGDNVVVDFDSKKRMKYVIAEFDEGEAQDSPFAFAYEDVKKNLEEKIAEVTASESKCQEFSNKVDELTTEVEALRQFKNDVEAESEMAQKNELFTAFVDLNDNDEFKALVEKANEYDIETLEEKCYAIRGKNVKMNFSVKDTKPTKLPIIPDKEDTHADPYGGVVEKYRRK